MDDKITMKSLFYRKELIILEMLLKKEEYISSPLNYIGGKYKLLNQIIPIFPSKINRFIDLFAGGFNVGINVNAKEIICNDYMFQIINLFKAFNENELYSVLNHIEKRIEEYKLSKENREGYNKFRELYNFKKEPLDLYVLICFSFNHQVRFNNKMEYNNPFGKDRSSYNARLKKKLINFKETLDKKNIQFTSKDFVDFDYEKLDESDFLYADPPYLISTGTYNDGKRGFKGWSEKEEIQLLEKLDYLDYKKVKFALSNVFYHKGNENKLLIEWSKKYKVHNIDSNYKNSNYNLNKDKKHFTFEVLITNY